jgi:hypothetical protein
MNKELKLTIGLIAVTALGYYLWKQSQKTTPVVTSTSVEPTPPVSTMPVTPVESMPAPTSNFIDTKSIFAPYANMAAAPSGGFFDSQKAKLNY